MDFCLHRQSKTITSNLHIESNFSVLPHRVHNPCNYNHLKTKEFSHLIFHHRDDDHQQFNEQIIENMKNNNRK